MEKLQEYGWYLSEQGFDLASDNGSVSDAQKIIKRALDLDLREISSGKGDLSSGGGSGDLLVLQIQKLRNISAPKYNEESKTAPRMLKLSLTDGKNNYQAVELEQIAGLSLNTPPGTKLSIKTSQLIVTHGILLLGGGNSTRVLGGKVQNLVEKWELNRKLATHSRLRSVEEGGPPPWIPFGKKISKGGLETDKKSLGKDSLDKETTEFEAQRQDAIAEAARLGRKKIFGGGNKQLLDHSVQVIVEHGFTVEQAEDALKSSRNNVERALKSLQRTSENRPGREMREPREPRSKRFEKKTEETKPSSGKVSLFDFLEDKLPAQSDFPDFQPIQNSNPRFGNLPNNRLENQFERLELRSSDNSTKGGRSQKSGRGYQAPPWHAPEDGKYPRRGGNEAHSNFPQSNPGKPPRFQRNQEFQHQNQSETVYKSNNYQKSSGPNSDRSRNSVFTGAEGGPIFGGKIQKTSEENSKNHQTRNFPNVDGYGASSRGQKISDENLRNHRQSNFEQKTSKFPDFRANRGLHNSPAGENAQNPTGNAVGSGEKQVKNFPKKQFQQHANRQPEVGANWTGSAKNSDNESAWVWKLGDDCMAKYWEDNRYYNAQVTAISARTCVVRFKDFDNYEEVLQADCIPITDEIVPEVEPKRNEQQRNYGNRHNRHEQSENHISGMEFRRGGGGGGGGSGGGNLGSKGYNRKRGQQRSAQPIYQPPAQRGHSSANWTPRENP